MKIINCKTVKFSRHSIIKMFQRSISKEIVKNILSNGEVIREYSNDKPYPSMLILGFSTNRPIHVVVAFNQLGKICIIVTLYEPSPEIWEQDYRSKK